MQVLVKELLRIDRSALERHFLALGAEDRRLRFGAHLGDFSVREYVARLDFDADAAFGVFDMRRLFMHCLSENETMLHLARKQGMALAAAAGEADAWLVLPPADPASLLGEVFEQRAALFDYALKQGTAWLARGR